MLDRRVFIESTASAAVTAVAVAATGQVEARSNVASRARSSRMHRFLQRRYYHTFSSAHAPVLTIAPGDRVLTRTVTHRTPDAAGNPIGGPPNPQTGPFYIEGAEPGDTLKVTLHRVEPDSPTAFSRTLLDPYALDPDFLRTSAEREQRLETWVIDRARRVARTSSAGLRPGPIEVPLAPMLGCIATAPANKEAIRSTTPGPFGGNMDYPGVEAGATVMLPVNEPGALLFIGDGHARQGQGEIVGTGLETSMEVEFSVELAKDSAIAWPRLENAEYVMTLGSARPLLQALQHATTEMLRWLVATYRFDERTASMLMGASLEYEIANVVDPNFTVVAKMRKGSLPAAT